MYQFEEAAYNCIHLKNWVCFLQLEYSTLENHGGNKGIALRVSPFIHPNTSLAFPLHFPCTLSLSLANYL